MSDLVDRARAAQRLSSPGAWADAACALVPVMADRIAALEAEAKDLQAKLTECCLQALATDGQAGEALDRAIKAEAELARLRRALTPSAATKAAYWGEFLFQRATVDEDGNETVEQVQVPWTTIKAIMAAIRASAALGDASAQQDSAALNTGDAT